MFYKFLNYLTKTKIRVFVTKALKRFSPNFYQQLSNLLLTKKSNLVFSKEFYDIVRNEEEVRRNEEEVRRLDNNIKAGKRILKKLWY